MTVRSHTPLLYLLLLGCPVLVASRAPTKDQECLSAVLDVYGSLQFEGVGYGDYYASACGNPAKVASIYAAGKVYCTPSERQVGADLLNEYCVKYGPGPLMPESDVASNTTEAAIQQMKTIDSMDDAATTNYTDPIMISDSLFKLAYRTEDDWDSELRLHTNYGFSMYGFWGGILVIGMLRRLFHLFQSRRSAQVDAEGSASSRHVRTGSRARTWIRKHITTPSVLATYHAQPFFGCTIPTRLEFIVIYLYWIISIILCAVNYRGFEGNLYWAKISPQTWRYIADRTGIICYANLPLLWMFSGRNNAFIWLTGWEFSVFNLFHRHIARVATLQAIIHSVAYTVFYYAAGEWESYFLEWKEAWWYLGAAATVSMSFIVFLSFRIFRHRTYEFFLLTHILLSVVVIVALFYHTSIFEGDYNPYLWPLVAIWSFDRLVRIIRVIYCNIHVHLGAGQTIHRTVATVINHENANVLEIKVTPAIAHLSPGPGQHYFLYQPFRLTGWENHPFTLASYDQSSPDAGQAGDVSFSFWARPQDGWTSKLRKECNASPNSTLTTTILVEGPYGIAKPLWEYDEVVFIAGGSGIAAVMPYLQQHMDQCQGSRPTRTKVIHFIWTDRNEENVALMINGPLSRVLSREDINTALHITQSSRQSEVLTPTEKPDPNVLEDASRKMVGVLEPRSQESLNLQQGRPDVRDIISRTASEVSSRGSRLAVFACGPATLADAARDATRRAMRDGNDVHYYEEAFGW